MRVITVGNEKGGVGKTTIASVIAGLLADEGHRVLYIDADAQGTGTQALGLEKEPCLYNWLVRNAPVKDVLRPVAEDVWKTDHAEPGGLLAAVPSNVETRNIANSISGIRVLRNKLKALDSIFDFVVIDTSPTPSLLHGAIYIGTDFMLYVTQPHNWSVNGIEETMNHVAGDSETKEEFGYRGVRTLGIVPNMCKSNTIVGDAALEYLQENYNGQLWRPVRDRETWRQAGMMGQLVYKFAPNTDAAEDAYGLVEQLMVVVNSEAINE